MKTSTTALRSLVVVLLMLISAFPGLYAGDKSGLDPVEEADSKPATDPGILSALEQLELESAAGGSFTKEEARLLAEFSAGRHLASIEAETLLSRSLSVEERVGPLTSGQKGLLDRFAAFRSRQDGSAYERGEEEHASKFVFVEASALDTSVPGTLGQGYSKEVEPNNSSATATPIAGTDTVLQGNVYPNGDADYFSFTAAAGDKVYAAVMTSWSSSSSVDSVLTLYQGDGTTVIEADDNDGTFGSTSSTIAGASIPSAGTYYLKVNHFSATGQLRPYDLHFRIQGGAPVPEVEPNNDPATATPLPSGGWVSGTRDPADSGEMDFFSFAASAGDTVFISLDMDPERDNVQWNGRAGLGLFGDAGNMILVVNDTSAGSAANPLSEAMMFTIKDAGTYYVTVDSSDAAVGGPTATYTLSVSVHPAADEGVNCTTYTSTDVPQTIPTGPGMVSSTITVPGTPRIADMDIKVTLTHNFMADLDVHLRSPAGNDIGLFTDIGSATAGQNVEMDTVFDDEAGCPPAFTVLKGTQLKPELNYRLSWVDGENAGGTWTLDIRDDATGDGGTLTGWSIRICEQPPDPACGAGTADLAAYNSDFESDDGGFTHNGTQDEWTRGLPTAAPITDCNSGTNCWKTDLAGTYNASSSQDLLSPAIDLSNAVAPIQVTWYQKFQMESASFDHAYVQAQLVGGGSPVRLWEWTGATMTSSVGSPTATIQESSGWSRMTADVSAYAGQSQFQLLFHVDSDTTVQLAGLAIDDVSVDACRLLSADLSVTKTDGLTDAVPGTSVTYTITASNAGPDPVAGATLADTLPASLAGATWTCVGAGGGTCTGAGAGNINDWVDLPVGASVTYTVSATVNSSATGNLSNTATVSSAVLDPVPANNSATDTDNLTPSADISVTKTDSPDPVVPGQNITYTIIAANGGPSDAAGVSLSDTIPANCTFVSLASPPGWISTTPPVGGTGTVSSTATSLATGASATFTLVVQVAPATAGGTVISNTATVSASTADPVPGNNSASATTTVTPQADLSITKTDSPDPAYLGQNLSYTLTVSNGGPSGATGLSVVDTLPGGVTFVSASGTGWTCNNAGGTVTCTAASLANGASSTITIVITPTALGNINNTATVTATETDPNPANNSASAATLVNCPPVVSPPVITAITDNDACAQTGITLNFTAGSPATRHDLYVDGSLAQSGISSPLALYPADTASHSYVVRAVNIVDACYSDSAASAFADASGTPSQPVIASITDTSWTAFGLVITYTPGSPATRHDLYRDGVLAAQNFVSGGTYYPSNNYIHEYRVAAVNGTCVTFSPPVSAKDMGTNLKPRPRVPVEPFPEPVQ